MMPSSTLEKDKKDPNFTNQAALDLFGGKPPHSRGGQQREQQPGGCTGAGGRGLKRLLVEVGGQQSGKQLWAAPTAGLQGTGEGKEGDGVLSHNPGATLPSQRCVYTKLRPWK